MQPSALVGLQTAPGALALPVADVEAAASYAKAEKAAATRRAYKTDFLIFQAWCADRGATALPAEPATVAAFLAWEANRQTRPSASHARHASGSGLLLGFVSNPSGPASRKTTPL